MSIVDFSSDFFNSNTLNEKFFTEIVVKRLRISPEKFKIDIILIAPAIGVNENFLSKVFRAKIKISLDNNDKSCVDIVFKVMQTSFDELEGWNVFAREEFIYENIIPSFEEIWRERAGEKVEFGPKFLKAEMNPYQIIVLDDLKANGYEMMDRKIGIDFEQSKLLLSLLAKFHAASAVYIQNVRIISSMLFILIVNKFSF